MKIKIVDDKVVLENGNPVFIKDDGTEQAYDVGSLVGKISELNRESAKYRVRAKDLAAKIEGVDLDAATKALQTVKDFDDKKLIDAGEAEKVKAEMVKGYKKQIDDLVIKNKALIDNNNASMLKSAFESSQFIKEKTILPADIAFQVFKDRFTVDDGVVKTKDTIMSQQNPGDSAGFDEALSLFVNSRPDKAYIIKTNAGGSGSHSNSGGGMNGKNPFKDGNVTEQAALIKKDRDTAAAMATAAGKTVPGLNN